MGNRSAKTIPVEPFDEYCTATTKSGDRCKRAAKQDGLCWQHGGGKKKETFKPTIPTITEEFDKLEISSVSYIYLIREREFLKKGEQIYKVGRTTQKPNARIARFDGYKKDSELIIIVECLTSKVVEIETDIKRQFNVAFKLHTDGTESFYGNAKEMAEIIYETIRRYG